MPLLFGILEESPRLTERAALMHLTRQETDTLRARDFISLALYNNHRAIISIKSFTVNEKVWFHRKRHGWRAVIISAINHPTITIEFEVKLYLTHNSAFDHTLENSLYLPPPRMTS